MDETIKSNMADHGLGGGWILKNLPRSYLTTTKMRPACKNVNKTIIYYQSLLLLEMF